MIFLLSCLCEGRSAHRQHVALVALWVSQLLSAAGCGDDCIFCAQTSVANRAAVSDELHLRFALAWCASAEWSFLTSAPWSRRDRFGVAVLDGRGFVLGGTLVEDP